VAPVVSTEHFMHFQVVFTKYFHQLNVQNSLVRRF